MSSVSLTESQRGVVEFLKNLPNPCVITVEVQQQVNPFNGRVSERIFVKGASSPANEPNRCVECGHSEHGTVISATFEWYRGKFKRAQVWTGTRRKVPSIEAAKGAMLRFIRLRDEPEAQAS